jgi:very-short-patch-repair endonuclease
MGAYVLDFYCPRAKLAVEVDGIAHGMGDQPVRDGWLRDQGVHVLRIAASAVMDDADEETDNILPLALARIAGQA